MAVVELGRKHLGGTIMCCSRLRVHGVLVALVLLVGLPPMCADDKDAGNEITLAQLTDSICLGNGVEPAYLVGKAFSAMLGSAVMHADVNEEIPFLDETRKHLSYSQIPPLDRESCHTVLGALHSQVSQTKRYRRVLKLRQCVQDTLGQNVSRAGNNERWAWHVLDEVLSEMALATDYVESLICTAFGKRKIALAFVQSLGGGLLPEEEKEDAAMLCSRDRAKQGECRAPENADVEQIPLKMRAAMLISLKGCNHVAWWLCNGASSVERHIHAETFGVPVLVAAARFLHVMHAQVGWEARHIINTAYRYVLGREADVDGYAQYTRLVAVGESAENIHKLLRQSREYVQYEKEQGGLEEVEEQVQQIFREVLMRLPEATALKEYAVTVQQQHGVERVRKILAASEEYRELCLREDKPSCEATREAVRRVFAEELRRPPDLDGLHSYTREIQSGAITMDRMRELIRGSDEYRFGVRLKVRAQEVAEAVQGFYPQCEAAVGAEQRHLLGVGRWCERGGCGEEAAEACRHWPVRAYQEVQAVAWGQAEVAEVAGGEAGAGEEAVRRLTKNHDDVLAVFVEALGRFPTAAELVGALGRLKGNQSAKAEVLEEVAMRRDGREVGVEEATKWGHRLELLANLLEKHGIALPPEPAECFGRGWMVEELGLSLYCKQLDLQLSEIEQPPPPGNPECLSGRASWTICTEGRWLCRPIPGKMVMPALYELSTRSEERGLPGAVRSWVYFAHGTKRGAHVAEADMCGSFGTVLATLQAHWNRHGPIFKPPPATSAWGFSWGAPKPQVPIAIYVHQRPQYFREVLAHLRKVRGIRGVPVFVISMDSVEREMLEIAQGIDFVPFRIVFHPARADLLPMQPLLAIKMHWMWLQDMLWTQVPETRGYDGHIALLEEDHVVTPDYLEVITLLLELKASDCPRCWAVCVKYGCRDMSDTEEYKVCRTHSVMNTGIAFNRSTYEAIRRSDFAAFADGWDWSLFHLAQTGQMADMMLAPAVSRIRNIGVRGATVRDDGDDFLQQQLDYKDVGEHAQFRRDRFFIDHSVPMHYVPPAWEPLYLGSLGFIAT